MKLFDQSSATSACAAFTELLGQDSTLLRLHVEVANLIYNHKCVISETPHSKQQSSKFSLHAKIGELVKSFLYRTCMYVVPLDMKGCICDFAKWQIIHPFISKGKMYYFLCILPL